MLGPPGCADLTVTTQVDVSSPRCTCGISSLQLTDKFVHKFVKNFPECRPDGFCSSGIFLLNPLCFSQVSSYGGYLRYRLYTQTMRGDVLSLPAEASRPDILLKVLDRVLGLTAVKPKCSNSKCSGSSGESDDAGLHGERVFHSRRTSPGDRPHR